MDNRQTLIYAIDEIANLHDLGKKTSDTLKEITLHTLAMENLLMEKEIFSEEELLKEINKLKGSR